MTKEAFAEQVVLMQDVLYRISYSMLQNPNDQADAVQESLRRALQKRETLRHDEYLQTWLIRILINVCNDMMRRRAREIPVEEIRAALPPESDHVVVEALAQIDVRFRLPLTLHHIEGYTTKEIARILRIPEGTVKTRLARGRRYLKEILQEGGLGYEGA